VLITHEHDVAERAQRVVRILDGKIDLDGQIDKAVLSSLTSIR
jgi:ABC-type lipoprotein export system ATPase subunit